MPALGNARLKAREEWAAATAIEMVVAEMPAIAEQKWAGHLRPAPSPT
jgi:hypothetical protein